jgi:hypothetical protein
VERAARVATVGEGAGNRQYIQTMAAWHGRCSIGWGSGPSARPGKERAMNNVFYIIGVVVVVLAVLGYFGFR